MAISGRMELHLVERSNCLRSCESDIDVTLLTCEDYKAIAKLQ